MGEFWEDGIRHRATVEELTPGRDLPGDLEGPFASARSASTEINIVPRECHLRQG